MFLTLCRRSNYGSKKKFKKESGKDRKVLTSILLVKIFVNQNIIVNIHL